MLKKLIFAAVAIASVVTLASAPAQANPDFFFGVGFGDGGPGFYHPHPGFYPPPYPDYDPPPPEPVYYPEPYPHHYRHHHYHDTYYSGVSCGGGANILRRSGFRGVSADDCSGPVYSYQAWKHGEQFDVQVSDRGRIISVDPAY